MLWPTNIYFGQTTKTMHFFLEEQALIELLKGKLN